MTENSINLDMPTDLVLSRQYVYQLENNDIYTIRQLVTKPEEEILNIINNDKESLDNIEKELSRFRLKLNSTDIENTPSNDKFYDFNKELKSIKNRIGKISLLPLKTTLARRQITKKQICKKLPVLEQYFIKPQNSDEKNLERLLISIGANNGDGMPVNVITNIAEFLKVPLSQIVLFTGYEIKDSLRLKYKKINDFEAKTYNSCVQSYAPLKETLKYFFDGSYAIEELLNDVKIDKNCKNAFIERILTEKEYVYDNLIHLSWIYKICELLQCNIDYVLTYKEAIIINNEELNRKLKEKGLSTNTPIDAVFQLSGATRYYLYNLNINTVEKFVLLTEEGLKKWSSRYPPLAVKLEIIHALSEKGLYSKKDF